MYSSLLVLCVHHIIWISLRLPYLRADIEVNLRPRTTPLTTILLQYAAMSKYFLPSPKQIYSAENHCECLIGCEPLRDRGDQPDIRWYIWVHFISFHNREWTMNWVGISEQSLHQPLVHNHFLLYSLKQFITQHLVFENCHALYSKNILHLFYNYSSRLISNRYRTKQKHFIHFICQLHISISFYLIKYLPLLLCYRLTR